jgi:hypothetical protein
VADPFAPSVIDSIDHMHAKSRALTNALAELKVTAGARDVGATITAASEVSAALQSLEDAASGFMSALKASKDA